MVLNDFLLKFFDERIFLLWLSDLRAIVVVELKAITRIVVLGWRLFAHTCIRVPGLATELAGILVFHCAVRIRVKGI